MTRWSPTPLCFALPSPLCSENAVPALCCLLSHELNFLFLSGLFPCLCPFQCLLVQYCSRLYFSDATGEEEVGGSKGWLHSWWFAALADFMPSGTSPCCPEGERKAISSVAVCWGLIELWVGLCYVAGAETCSVPNPARCHFSNSSRPASGPDHVGFLCHYTDLLLTNGTDCLGFEALLIFISPCKCKYVISMLRL